MGRAYYEPVPVTRPKPARSTTNILPVDLAVTGDLASSGLVDVHLDPGGNDPIRTVRLTADLVVALHTGLTRKLLKDNT